MRAKSVNSETWREFHRWLVDQDKRWSESPECKQWEQESVEISKPFPTQNKVRFFWWTLTLPYYPSIYELEAQLNKIKHHYDNEKILRLKNGTFRPEATLENCLYWLASFKWTKSKKKE